MSQSKNNDQENEPLDIEQVKKAINQAKDIIKSSESRDNIGLFLGFGGTGKSSAITILSGQQVKGYYQGSSVLIEGNPAKQSGVRISQLFHTGTKYPAMLKLKQKGGHQQVMLWDLLGLGENKGVSQSLINSYFIHRIFEFYKNIKIIFTIDYIQIVPNRKGENLQRTLHELTEFLGNFDDYSQGVIVMITKADHRAKKEDIYEYFKQILTLSSFAKSKNYKNFIQCIVDKKIPLLLVKQPNVPRIAVQNAIDVTPQYQQLIQQAYQIIVGRLKTATTPKLRAPIMSQNEILKCKGIVEDTQTLIEKYIRAIVEPLKQFITGFYGRAIFSEDLKKVQEGFEYCQRMTYFVNKIHQASQIENISPGNEKQELKNRFDELQRIFESEKYLCERSEKGTEVCEPMVALYDQYIMIRFLNTLKFDEKPLPIKWKTQSQVLKRLFKEISALELKNHWESLELDINKRFIDFIEMNFKNTFVDKLKNENFFLEWKNQYKYFPYFIHHASQSIQSKDSIKYFEGLKQISIKCKIKQIPKIELLINLLNLNKQFLSKGVGENALKNLKDHIGREGNQMISNVISNCQNFQKVPEAFQQYSKNKQKQIEKERKEMQQKLRLKNELKQAKDGAYGKQMMIQTKNNEIMQLNNEINRLKPEREKNEALQGQNSRLLTQNKQLDFQNDKLNKLLKNLQQKKHQECCIIY